jgi:hypothetical protein
MLRYTNTACLVKTLKATYTLNGQITLYTAFSVLSTTVRNRPVPQCRDALALYRLNERGSFIAYIARIRRGTLRTRYGAPGSVKGNGTHKYKTVDI